MEIQWGRQGARTSGMRIAVAIVLATAGLTVLSGPAQAEVHVNQTPAPSWRTNGRVYVTRIVGGTVFVGGDFSRAISPTGQTVPRENLAAFDFATGDLLTGWRADANNTVRDVVSDGTSIWVGGSFGNIDGVTRRTLAKLDVATGQVDTSFNARLGSGGVRGLALDSSGDLYVGGGFGAVAGVTRDRLAKVEGATGDLDSRFVGRANNIVYGLALAEGAGRLYAVGRFGNLGSASRNGVGAVSTTTGASTGPVFENAVRPSLAVDVNDSGSRLYVAGANRDNNAQAWNTANGDRLWRHRAMGDNQAIRYHDGTVYFGFHEGFQGDETVRLLAAEAESGELDPNFRPTFDRFIGVWAIDANAGGLVAGGVFTRVNGVRAQGWVRWPSGDPVPPPPPPPPPPPAGETVDLVDASTPWRYLDEGIRPDGWEDVGFDDSTWASGLPEFGYGDGDETTVVSFGPSSSDKYITTYFRTTFTAPSEGATRLEVSLLADDGAAVFVNGQEVVRDNLPDGTLTQDTRTPSGRANASERRFRDFPIPLDAIDPGSNTIAVEVHQRSPRSSDISFDLRLTGDFPTS